MIKLVIIGYEVEILPLFFVLDVFYMRILNPFHIFQGDIYHIPTLNDQPISM